MSDNSTGSSASSNNSWTLLSPEEAAIDTAGSVDDGTESIGDAPSLSEEVAASSLEVKPSESETPLETILSEEGHQICQETSPEFFEECGASGLASVEADPDICAPVIHDTITSSPPDNDLLGAVPFSIATESSLFLPEEPVLEQETFPEVQPTFELPPKEIPASGPIAEVTPDPEPTEISFSPETPDSLFPDVSADVIPVSVVSPVSAVPVVDVHAEISTVSESPAPRQPSEADFGSVAEGPLSEGPCPETVTSSVLEEEEPAVQDEEPELAVKSADVVWEPETLGADVSLDNPEEGDGLRLRHVQHTDIQRQSSDEEEEEEEEEEEFKLPERKEEKSGFSMNHLIVGALALLCLGSLFFSGFTSDQAGDFDGSELSDQELLEKLAQENKQISILEAQIQSQKEELDKALRIAAEKGATDKENAKMKEELSALPALKNELEALKARITELTQLTAAEPSETSSSSLPSAPDVPGNSHGPTGPDGLWDKQKELKRQKSLLEESRKRLEGIKKHSWHKKGVRESLVELQQRLSEQVDHLGKRDEWKRKQKEHKDAKKVWTEKSNQWESGDMEKRKDWKLGKDKHDGGPKHKEHLKKYGEEWDHKKNERKLERERRKQERPWQGKTDHHHNHHKQQQQHVAVDFWRHQEEKLRRNQSPPKHCRGVADCAEAEGLVPVKLTEFQALLEVYVSKLSSVDKENIEALQRLVGQFFRGGVFSHDDMLFSEFAEDVADILEDLADVLTDDDVLEEEMEQFEKEALWKFAATSA